jgi:RimJ/RimL family protein N-acetyltransferase
MAVACRPATSLSHPRMELRLKKSTIRDWRPSDEASLARYANNRKVWRNLHDAFPHPYTLLDARKWIRAARAATPTTAFAITVHGAAVGGIGLILGADVFRRSAEIGYWLAEDFWGQGIATEAVEAMSEHAFVTFDLCRLSAGVYEWNQPSMRVLEKVGYECEGRLRKSVTKDGHTIDEVIYALVRSRPARRAQADWSLARKWMTGTATTVSYPPKK